MSVYTIYKELFPPQTVEHVERGQFTAPDAINVIVAKASLLQVYSFVEYLPSQTSDIDTDDDSESQTMSEEQNRFDDQDKQTLTYPKLKPLKKDVDTTSGRLELVAQYKLNGTIATMGIIRTSSPRGKQGCDSLLLGFNDAKMSLLEWSPATNSIVTVSIHYYERDEFKKEFLSNPYPPEIHIDPQQRCAILNFYGEKLAVLPFNQSEKLDAPRLLDNDDNHGQKWPYSPSFIIDLEKIDRRIKNVIDMTFLADYYEPTLAILFQTEQTWTGRLANAKDTVSVVVISLDLSAKVYPIIYSLDHLPYDCRKLVAMPKPVDGMLVIASNSLLHISQGSPGVGVAVNGYTKLVTDFPGMIYEENLIEMGLVLDGARALTIEGGKCILFLQNGNWVVVNIKLDGSRVVGINLDQIDWSGKIKIEELAKGIKRAKEEEPAPLVAVPSCVTSVKDGEYFFLGSRVGDSMLIKWNHSELSARNQITKAFQNYTFRVCDTLLNTGPIVDMAIGLSAGASSEDTSQENPDMELVSCSGDGKSGALCVFQRHIRPISTFSFQQQDCQAIWSVKCRKEQYFDGVKVGGKVQSAQTPSFVWENDANNGTAEDNIMGDAFDKLLFISKASSTLVLAAGEELQELQNTNFYTAGRTLAVSTLFEHTRIVQVHAQGVMLLSPDGKLIQAFSARNAKIEAASIQDPYILIKLDNNTIAMYCGDESTKEVVSIPVPSTINDKKLSMASLFADSSGLFSSITERMAQVKKNTVSDKKRKAEEDTSSTATKKSYTKSTVKEDDDFDEIDLDLYGDQDATMEDKPAQQEESTNNMATSNYDIDDDEAMLYGQETEPNDTTYTAQETVDEVNVSVQGNVDGMQRVSYWCITYTVEGTLQMFSLPDFQECFSVPQFDQLATLLSDSAVQESHASGLSTEKGTGVIQEILMTHIGKERKDPHLIVRTETNDIVIYKAFKYLPTTEYTELPQDENLLKQCGDRLALRFSRAHHEYVSHTPPSTKQPSKEPVLENINGIETESAARRQLLFPFNNVAGYAGVFVAGKQPAWLMCSCKSFVRVHPMKANAEVLGFTQFHNVNCQRGFITLDTNSNLRLCRLPTEHVTYDMDWIVQKIPLGQSVHKIQYHPIMHVYAVLVSVPKPVRLRNDDGTPIDEQPEEREPGMFLPTVDQHALLMISPVTWETVDRVELQEYEQGLSLHCASLESKQTSTGKKYFMSVGTAYLRGEDTAMRGSIYIFDIIEVVPEPNNPQTNHRFKHLHTEDAKGAVTALCDVSGHLVACVGSKVYLWSFEDNESLVGVAFIDVQIYVTSICSIKNFIVLGDTQKSVWFLGFQLEPAKLVLLGKDYQSFEVSAVNYIVDDKSLYLLVGDTDDNLDIFQYAPFNLQSFAGQKLMRRGDFHVGKQIRSMVRLPQIVRTDKGLEYSRRHFCLCGSFGGSISAVSPIPEKTFKRLNTVYGQLVNGLQHVAGLNPRAFRLIKGPKQRMSSNRTKAVLDGDLIFEFAGLSVTRQREMTKQIGTTVAKIMEDLVDIDTSIDHF